jgi:hypothetical protein
VAGAAAAGVTSFFLITLRFAAVFLAFLEDFFTFFFAIYLLDDTAAYMPSKRHVERKKGKSEGAHDKDINIIHVRLRKAGNDPDFVDLVEFLKEFKHDPRVSTKLESPSG